MMNKLVLLTEDGKYQLSQKFLKELCRHSSGQIKLILSPYFDLGVSGNGEAKSQSPGDSGSSKGEAGNVGEASHLPCASGIQINVTTKYYEAQVTVCHMESSSPSYVLSQNVRKGLLGDCDAFFFVGTVAACEKSSPYDSALAEFLNAASVKVESDDSAGEKEELFLPSCLCAVVLSSGENELSEAQYDLWEDYCLNHGIELIVCPSKDASKQINVDRAEKVGIERAAEMLYLTDWGQMSLFSSKKEFLGLDDESKNERDLAGGTLDKSFVQQLQEPERIQAMRAFLFEKKNREHSSAWESSGDDLKTFNEADEDFDIISKFPERFATIKAFAAQMPLETRREFASRTTLAIMEELMSEGEPLKGLEASTYPSRS